MPDEAAIREDCWNRAVEAVQSALACPGVFGDAAKARAWLTHWNVMRELAIAFERPKDQAHAESESRRCYEQLKAVEAAAGGEKQDGVEP